jgi:hypothetical protein
MGVGVGVGFDAGALRRARVRGVCAPLAGGSKGRSELERRAAVRSLLAASGKRDTSFVTSLNFPVPSSAGSAGVSARQSVL